MILDGETAKRSCASVPPPPVNPPGPVQALTLTPGDHELGVRWRAPLSTGGQTISRYQVQYKEAAVTAWTSNPEVTPDVTDHTATTVPILTGDERMPLTNGVSYHVQVRACNGPTDRTDCGAWEQQSGTREAPRPRNLDVLPLRERKVRLTWTWTGPQANAFLVTARGFGVNRQSRFYEWRRVHTGRTTPAEAVDESASTYKLEFYLNLMYRASGGALGLQHHPAYDVQVQAVTGKDSSNNDILSVPSDAIIVIDTPIRSANGKSSGTGGEALLSWNLMQHVLEDDSYANGTAWFRHRRGTGGHSDITWHPEEANFKYVADVPETLLKDGNTLVFLELYKLHAIQFWYEPPVSQGSQPIKRRVFAGRDVYVWPSTRAGGVGMNEHGNPAAGERVASYPLNYPVENTDREPRQTYVYRLCDNTFPDLEFTDSYGHPDLLRANNWEDFIFDAFDRWRVATDGLVVAAIERVPCATYSAVVEQVVQSLGRSLDGSLAAQYDENTRRAHVQALVDQSRHLGTLRDAVLRAAMDTSDNPDVGNEVFMYESSARPMVYEFGQKLQPGLCDRKAYGCARLHGVPHETKGWITDIALKKDASFEVESGRYVPEIPTVGLDMCLVRLDANQEHSGPFPSRPGYRFMSVYTTLVHELGHAFGIREGASGPEDDTNHPNDALKEDSVMIGVGANMDCAPSPLDVL